MLWEMFFCWPRLKNQKFNQKIKSADLFDFLMSVSSRYKTQKINISGPGFYASGEHDFSKPGANSENLIFRFSDSIFRLTEVSEFLKPRRGQSTKASGPTQAKGPTTRRNLSNESERL